MEMRSGRVTASKAGGTAWSGSKTYKISLPSAWINMMGLTENDGRVILSFDGRIITLRPEQSMKQYLDERRKRGHEMLEIRYYNKDSLCTLIYADQTAKDLKAENYTEQSVKTAFGKNRLPSWADLEAFLEERCIPRRRAGMREYLETLGLSEYEPLAVIRKTQGRMAEDDQWMEVHEIR